MASNGNPSFSVSSYNRATSSIEKTVLSRISPVFFWTSPPLKVMVYSSSCPSVPNSLRKKSIAFRGRPVVSTTLMPRSRAAFKTALVRSVSFLSVVSKVPSKSSAINLISAITSPPYKPWLTGPYGGQSLLLLILKSLVAHFQERLGVPQPASCEGHWDCRQKP